MSFARQPSPTDRPAASPCGLAPHHPFRSDKPKQQYIQCCWMAWSNHQLIVYAISMACLVDSYWKGRIYQISSMIYYTTEEKYISE